MIAVTGVTKIIKDSCCDEHCGDCREDCAGRCRSFKNNGFNWASLKLDKERRRTKERTERTKRMNEREKNQKRK